jgi:sulfite reductase (NADPH) hemoprotein beta-component
MSQPSFPCEYLPADAANARLLGLYPQRQEGLWMQRVRVPGGLLSSGQWAALAAVVHELTPTEPLHLTTRQDVEIHGLSDRTVPLAQQALAAAGLTGLGGCGDTVRNITVCPCAGVAPGAPDLLPLAAQITDMLQSQPDAFDLPRKFKVSLSACPQACGLPWMHDVGLVAKAVGAGWVFRATMAGSLGHAPELGIAWPVPLRPTELQPFVLAAMEVFGAHGDREHRGRARLRHARQRLGDEAFLDLLADRFQQTRRSTAPADVSLRAPTAGLGHRRHVAVPGGNIPPGVAETLGELAARDDMAVRLGLHHEIWLYAADPPPLDKAMDRLPSEWTNGPTIVSCPGTRWCSRGLVDSQGMAQRLRDELAGTASDKWVAVSGCSNGCAHSAVADIGLVGRIRRSNGERVEAYRVLVGGSAAKEPRLGRPLHAEVPAEEVPDLIQAQWNEPKE